MCRNTVLPLCLGMFIFVGIDRHEPCAAQTTVIVAEGEYVMGSGETMEVAEERARKAAMQSAAEQAGAFVKSYSEVKNFILERDVIEVIANHAMQVEVIDLKKTVVGDVDAIKFYVKIRATMTEEEIEANLQKVRDDQSIVDTYNRLKADYEKQNAEMEYLKRQLEYAVGGDRQKIARLISEEEKKFKANLWVEKAQHSSYFDNDALESYKKAIELNPQLAQAYVGMADVLRFQNMGESWELSELESKVKGLREGLANLDTAVSLDEAYADAYALRVEILEDIKKTESTIDQMKDGSGDFEDTEKQYNEQILKDINRAIALNASKKATMYQKRAFFYLNEANSAELERSPSDVIESAVQKAIADINQAIALCQEGGTESRIEYYNTKGQVYRYAAQYYLRAENTAKEEEYKDLATTWHQKAQALAEEVTALATKKEKEFEDLLKTSEIGKLDYALEFGWREKVLGSQQDLQGLSDEEKERRGKEKITEIKKRISSGTASAEDHLLMAMFDFDDNAEIRRNNYEKGIALLENRKPEGSEALLLVKFYIYKSQFHSDQQQYDTALNDLNKAKTVVDNYFIRAQTTLSLTDFQQLTTQMKTEGNFENAFRLSQAEAEAFYWLSAAVQIPYVRATVYEHLDLPARAIEEYRYLYETFKDEDAGRAVERLK